MTDEQLLERTTLNPKVMVGKPVIKGTRLTVEFILNLLAHGATFAEIIEEYDGLTEEDIQACLLFAKNSLEETAFMPLASDELALSAEETFLELDRRETEDVQTYK